MNDASITIRSKPPGNGFWPPPRPPNSPAQRPGELPVADVDRGDVPRAVLQQRVGEPPGRGTDVERVQSGRIDGERGQRAGQLLTAAADERRERLDRHLRARPDAGAGLRHRRLVDAHAAGQDQTAGLGAGQAGGRGDDGVEPARLRRTLTRHDHAASRTRQGWGMPPSVSAFPEGPPRAPGQAAPNDALPRAVPRRWCRGRHVRLRWPGEAAQFNYKLGNDQTPTHPMNPPTADAIKRIQAASNGQIEITLYPNSMLGGDTPMLSQLRSGALELMQIGNNILGAVIPASSLLSIPFAFHSAEQFLGAADGALGDHIGAAGAAISLRKFTHSFYGGFFEIQNRVRPIDRPAVLAGLKIRVPARSTSGRSAPWAPPRPSSRSRKSTPRCKRTWLTGSRFRCRPCATSSSTSK